MCATLEVSTSGYCEWVKRLPSRRSLEEEALLTYVRAIHEKSRGLYGSPRITAELRRLGIFTSENRVARIMRENNIISRTKRKFKKTTDSNHRMPVAPNLLEDMKRICRPDQAWVSDVTYIRVGSQWLYLATVMDAWSRKIVGWSMKDRITRDLVMDALQQALWRRHPGEGLVCHSDRGLNTAVKVCRFLAFCIFYPDASSRHGKWANQSANPAYFRPFQKG